MLECTLTGYSFRRTTVKPSGIVNLLWEEDNKYDKKAIAVWYKGTHIGYLKKNSAEQEYCYEKLRQGVEPRATVVEYRFGYEDDSGNMVFNDSDEGHLMHVKLEIEGHVGYQKDGKSYISITNLLKYINPEGDSDSLIQWAMTNYKSFEEYKDGLEKYADDGTELHKTIEDFLLKRGKGNEAIANFVKKYKPEVLSTEKTVFNDELGIAGTYDALLDIAGIKTVVDWKSSKKPRLKHKLQAAFLANEVGAEQAMVVCFGANTKQGFSVSLIDEVWITVYAKIVNHLAHIYNLLQK